MTVSSACRPPVTESAVLVINATSSIVSPALMLKLDPYLSANVTMFNPTPLVASTPNNDFANRRAGLYILTLIDAPAPACGNPNGLVVPCPATPITVRTNIGGVSPPSALPRIQ